MRILSIVVFFAFCFIVGLDSYKLRIHEWTTPTFFKVYGACAVGMIISIIIRYIFDQYEEAEQRGFQVIMPKEKR